jgi:hypothetical protein
LHRPPAREHAVGDDFDVVTFEAERVLQTERNARFVFSDENSLCARDM